MNIPVISAPLLRVRKAALCYGDKLLWEKGFIDYFSDSTDYSGDVWVYFIPLFSGDFKTLLYKEERGPMSMHRSAIIEINLNTGEATTSKRKCENPKYSPDEKYIFLQGRDKNHKFYIRPVTKKSD